LGSDAALREDPREVARIAVMRDDALGRDFGHVL
jgi:hypothetical protein